MEDTIMQIMHMYNVPAIIGANGDAPFSLGIDRTTNDIIVQYNINGILYYMVNEYGEDLLQSSDDQFLLLFDETFITLKTIAETSIETKKMHARYWQSDGQNVHDNSVIISVKSIYTRIQKDIKESSIKITHEMILNDCVTHLQIKIKELKALLAELHKEDSVRSAAYKKAKSVINFQLCERYINAFYVFEVIKSLDTFILPLDASELQIVCDIWAYLYIKHKDSLWSYIEEIIIAISKVRQIGDAIDCETGRVEAIFSIFDIIAVAENKPPEIMSVPALYELIVRCKAPQLIREFGEYKKKTNNLQYMYYVNDSHNEAYYAYIKELKLFLRSKLTAEKYNISSTNFESFLTEIYTYL